MYKINVKYFAALREIAGISEEIIETNSSSASELYDELDQKYSFSKNIDKSILKLAINETYEDFNSSLVTGDTIVFIPPVAGG